MDIIQIFNWAITHKTDLIQFFLQLIGAASIIVKMTPTLKDDEILGKVKNFISKWIAIN